MEPAPSPNGTAITKKQTGFFVNAKPNNATAVITVLTAVTPPTPKRLITLALMRLDTIVHALTVAEIDPASEIGKFDSL